jgi:hypothetical protein
MFDITHKTENLKTEIKIDDVPNGRSTAEFTYLNVLTQEKYDCRFISGFFSMKVEDNFITPYVGWVVTSDKRMKTYRDIPMFS